jgi:chromosome segregation ATPase
VVTLQKDAKIRELEDEISRLSKLVEESGSSSADLLQQYKGAVARIEELEEELRREKLEGKDLLKQIKLLEEQRDKLLSLQEDLMARISESESRRLNASDKGTMTSEPPQVCLL